MDKSIQTILRNPHSPRINSWARELDEILKIRFNDL